METTAVTLVEAQVVGDITGKVLVTVEGRDFTSDLHAVGLTIDSSDREIMAAMIPVVREAIGVDISDHYKVRKAVYSQNIYIVPNSTAG